MHKAPWILLIAFAATALLADPAFGDVSDQLAQARKLIVDKDLKAAAEVLEDALVDAPPTDRKTVVELLKETYKGLIKAAQDFGNAQAASTYEDDLAILEAASPKPATPASPPPAPAPAPAPAAPEPKPEVEPTPSPPETPAESVSVPRAEVEPDTPLAEPASDLPPLSDSAQEKDSTAIPDLPAVSTPDKTVDEKVDQVEARISPSKAPKSNSSLGEDLSKADGFFSAKNYEEAGRIYAALSTKGSLPAGRKLHWAYCRWAMVVPRINARPKSNREWDLIEQEVDNIQRLTPGNWFGVYLKDVVVEARGGRSIDKGASVIVRGATPDELDAEQTSRPARRPSSIDTGAKPAEGRSLNLPPLGSPELSPSIDDEEFEDAPQALAPNLPPARSGEPITWQVLETANFRIHHVDPKLASQAARAAEGVRASEAARWESQAARETWSPRCDLYLYPSGSDFARMTGQPETSPGFSTMGIGGGQVVARRVNLRADHPQLLSAILPHEVTHVVLADLFPDEPIPRWADEGMAVLAEPEAEQAGRAADLAGPLAEKRLFRLDQLMSIDNPESEDWNLYYAQSVSLTRFLTSQGTPGQFVAFVKEIQRRGIDVALRESYGIEGLSDLELRWRDHAHREANRLAVAPDSSTTVK